MRTSRSREQSFIHEAGSRTIVNRLTPARIWTVVALACLGVVLTGSWWNNWMAQGSSPVVRLGLKRERSQTYHISGERGSLSEAVSRAEDGDVLVLGEGHFEGDLHLDKRLTIRGSGAGRARRAWKPRAAPAAAGLPRHGIGRPAPREAKASR